MKKNQASKKSRASARAEKLVRGILSWAKADFDAHVKRAEEAISNEVRNQLSSFKGAIASEVQNQLFSVEKTIKTLIADADGRLRAAMSSALQEKVLPSLSKRALDEMTSQDWMGAVVEKLSSSVLKNTRTEIEKVWTQKTEEMKNLAPTIFTEYIKSPDFITKVVAQVNALQLRKD